MRRVGLTVGVCAMAVGVALAGFASAGVKGEVLKQSGDSAKMKLTYRCFTNQAGCAGIARFGPFNQPVSCRVLFGSGGTSNFVLYRAGDTHDIQVRTGDRFACVYGSNGVPTNTPIVNPIGVG